MGDRVFPNNSFRTDDTSSVIRLARDRLRGDLIRRFAPPSPCAGKALRAVEDAGPYDWILYPWPQTARM